jgi:hypothetical protein
MPKSSVKFFLMLRALYSMIYKNRKLVLGKNSLNVPNVKLLSNLFFQHFLGFLMHFCIQPLI